MLNIAIAGGGGLGYLFAIQFSQAPYDYSITVLSRSVSSTSQKLLMALTDTTGLLTAEDAGRIRTAWCSSLCG